MKTNWVMNLLDEKHAADMRTNKFHYFLLERGKIIKIVERVTLQKLPFQSHADRNNKINNFLLTLSP